MAELSPRQLLAVCLDASGYSPEEISQQTGYAINRISTFRHHNEAYIAKREELLRQIEARTVDRAVDLALQFDEIAPEAFETVRELNRDAEMETVRLNAAKEILDRAPSAPKSRKFVGGEGSGGVVIQLGAAQIDGIKATFEDIGDKEIIDLIEGRDFTTPMIEAPVEMIKATEV